MRKRLFRLLAFCPTVLSVALVLAITPGATSPATVDLIAKTSVVGYDFDPGNPDPAVHAKAIASAKVQTLGGGWVPWTEAAVKANARVEVVGKVDPVTHQPVGAVADPNPETDCEPGDGFYAPFTSCLVIYWHINQPSGSYTWYTLDSWLRRSDCFATGSRYSNLYAPTATNKYATGPWGNGSCSNGVITYQGVRWFDEARIFNANSRAHTTWYNYPDDINGHPLIFIP
jgi:hypothetical protein